MNVSIERKWRDIAVANGINVKTFWSRVRADWSYEDAANVPPRTRVNKRRYDLYRGEQYIASGTVEELAALTGAKVITIRQAATEQNKRRYAKCKETSRRLVAVAVMRDEEEV